MKPPSRQAVPRRAARAAAGVSRKPRSVSMPTATSRQRRARQPFSGTASLRTRSGCGRRVDAGKGGKSRCQRQRGLVGVWSGLYRTKATSPAITVMSTTRSASSSSEHSSKLPDKTTRSASFPARREPRSRSWSRAAALLIVHMRRASIRETCSPSFSTPARVRPVTATCSPLKGW